MREIKLRVFWHKDKITTSVDTIEFLHGGIRVSDGCYHIGWQGKDCELREFTGVKERYPQMVGEGQEIYFGDVVRLFGGEYCQGYYEHDQTIVVKSAYDIVAMEESENVQLLGNVWDNPELLKEGSV